MSVSRSSGQHVHGCGDRVTYRSASLSVTLNYSTYLARSDLDIGYARAVGESGAAYVTGFTHSIDFRTLSPFQWTYQESSDGFVAALISAVLLCGDADWSGAVDIDDVVWLINYIFSGGYAPCDTDGDGVPDC